MIRKKDFLVGKIVDSILLNYSSIELSGLYNGKAGVALALFEASRYLQDGNLEDVAFSITKEALITKNDNISFEKGLSGVGYVLIHLIERCFLEADFNELFGNQHQMILQSIDALNEDGVVLFDYIKVIFYLKRYIQFSNGDYNASSAIDKLLKASEQQILHSLCDFSAKDKNLLIRKIEDFLSVVNYSQDYSYVKAVVDAYILLYEQGKIKSSLFLWGQLWKIAEKLHMKEVEKLAKRKVDFMTITLNLDALCFRDKVSALHSLNLKKIDSGMQSLHQGFDLSKFEHNVRTSVTKGHSYIGYEGGASRFLLHLVNSDIELL